MDGTEQQANLTVSDNTGGSEKSLDVTKDYGRTSQLDDQSDSQGSEYGEVPLFVGDTELELFMASGKIDEISGQFWYPPDVIEKVFKKCPKVAVSLVERFCKPRLFIDYCAPGMMPDGQMHTEKEDPRKKKMYWYNKKKTMKKGS